MSSSQNEAKANFYTVCVFHADTLDGCVFHTNILDRVVFRVTSVPTCLMVENERKVDVLLQNNSI